MISEGLTPDAEVSSSPCQRNNPALHTPLQAQCMEWRPQTLEASFHNAETNRQGEKRKLYSGPNSVNKYNVIVAKSTISLNLKVLERSDGRARLDSRSLFMMLSTMIRLTDYCFIGPSPLDLRVSILFIFLK